MCAVGRALAEVLFDLYGVLVNNDSLSGLKGPLVGVGLHACQTPEEAEDGRSPDSWADDALVAMTAVGHLGKSAHNLHPAPFSPPTMAHTPLMHQTLATPPMGGHDNPFSRPGTPHKEPHHIGFVGLGAMGHFMARNLANNRQSHPTGSPPLLVYNRTVSKAEDLVKEVGGESKVRIAQSPGEIAVECDIIVTNLGSDEAVRLIYQEFAKALTVSRNDITSLCRSLR